MAGRQRLAALAGILCRSTRGKANSKVVVFLSSKDSVEFHQQLFQGAFKFVAGRPLVDCPIYKLHGSLMQVRLVSDALCITGFQPLQNVLDMKLVDAVCLTGNMLWL